MRKLLIGLVALSFLSLISPITAATEGPIHAELVAEETAIQPGRPFWVALHLKLDENWHTYWTNPGDVGMAPCLEWKLPDGVKEGKTHWPVPKRFEDGETITFGYAKDVVILTQFHPIETLSLEEPIQIEANVSWIVCSNETCIPGAAHDSLKFTVTPLVEPADSPLFTEARSALPQHEIDLIAERTSDKLQIKFPKKTSLSQVQFFPDSDSHVDYKTAPTLHQLRDHTAVSLGENERGKHLKGVLVLLDGDRVIQSVEVDTPIMDKSALEIPFEGGLALYLFFAFIGGIILNLMPCVLPVISLKVMSFVQMAGESRRLILQHGLAFTLGVLLSFWTLAAVMLALQSYGDTVGWGFQLQEPLFVAALAALLFIFSLSMFGLFELGTSLSGWAGTLDVSGRKKSSPLIASLFSGVLATAVATPCTGPFLGTAIGFAVTQSAFGAMAIFTSLGLGMSLPYLLIAAYPPLLQFLPKPGNWMITFRQVLGFIMLATVIWLLWVFAAETSDTALIYFLSGLFIFSIGGWVFGKWGTPVKVKAVRVVSYGITLLALIGGGSLIYQATGMVQDSPFIAKGPHDGWEPFSEEKLQKLRAEGIPVLVDFTAKWCLICQTNHLVLATNQVDRVLQEKGVVKMKADWTKKDPTITAHLRKYGRNGVPLYLLFGSDPEADPTILPQVLTPEMVLNHLENV